MAIIEGKYISISGEIQRTTRTSKSKEKNRLPGPAKAKKRTEDRNPNRTEDEGKIYPNNRRNPEIESNTDLRKFG